MGAPRPPHADEALAALASRYSTGARMLVPPAPSDAQWAEAARIAARAPDHGRLRPFRFVIVGDEHRARLSELFAQDALRRGQSPADVERARERAYNGPGLAALIGRFRAGVDDVPVQEQWMCCGAALMNFLNALHLVGFGAKAVSGPSVRDAAIRAAFCAEGETLLTWVIAGTTGQVPRAKRGDEGDVRIESWVPPHGCLGTRAFDR
jgi:nitroreductase